MTDEKSSMEKPPGVKRNKESPNDALEQIDIIKQARESYADLVDRVLDLTVKIENVPNPVGRNKVPGIDHISYSDNRKRVALTMTHPETQEELHLHIGDEHTDDARKGMRTITTSRVGSNSSGSNAKEEVHSITSNSTRGGAVYGTSRVPREVGENGLQVEDTRRWAQASNATEHKPTQEGHDDPEGHIGQGSVTYYFNAQKTDGGLSGGVKGTNVGATVHHRDVIDQHTNDTISGVRTVLNDFEQHVASHATDTK